MYAFTEHEYLCSVIIMMAMIIVDVPFGFVRISNDYSQKMEKKHSDSL